MNNLLFDEPPIVVSPTLAKMLNSLEEAAILQQIHYWTQKNMNIRDGYSWVYNTTAEWQKQFSWIKSDKTMRTKLKSLENKGLLVTGNYNKAKFDRTKWYRIDYDAFSQMVTAFGKSYRTNRQELPNATGKNYPTNTIDYTETTTDIDDADDSLRDALNFQFECRKNLLPVTKNYERNFGQITESELMKLIDSYRDWHEAGISNENIIAVFNKALEKAAIYRAKSPAKYTAGILKSWLKNKIWTVEAVEGEEKQFEARKQQRQSNATSAKQTMERDLSNKHYGTDEELEAEFFGEAH